MHKIFYLTFLWVVWLKSNLVLGLIYAVDCPSRPFHFHFHFLQCICVCTLYRLFHITQVIIKILAAGGHSSIAHKLWKWLIDNFISAHGVQQQQQPAFAVACDPFKIRETLGVISSAQLSCVALSHCTQRAAKWHNELHYLCDTHTCIYICIHHNSSTHK